MHITGKSIVPVYEPPEPKWITPRTRTPTPSPPPDVAMSNDESTEINSAFSTLPPPFSSYVFDSGRITYDNKVIFNLRNENGWPTIEVYIAEYKYEYEWYALVSVESEYWSIRNATDDLVWNAIKPWFLA